MKTPPLVRVNAARPHNCPLTRRQLDVLALVAQGKTDPEIAQAFGMSAHTIHGHCYKARKHTATTSRTASVVVCLRERWLIFVEEDINS